LNINLPNTDFVGLFLQNSGSIKNINVSGSVTGKEAVGGLIGFNGGIVSNCTSSGSVTGNDHIGGLIGINL